MSASQFWWRTWSPLHRPPTRADQAISLEGRSSPLPLGVGGRWSVGGNNRQKEHGHRPPRGGKPSLNPYQPKTPNLFRGSGPSNTPHQADRGSLRGNKSAGVGDHRKYPVSITESTHPGGGVFRYWEFVARWRRAPATPLWAV